MTAATTAPLRIRLASMLYESVLLAGVLAVAFLLPHALLGYFAHYAAAPGTLWGHLFLLLFAYFAWFWLHGGQTLAMKTWRIRLINAQDEPLELWQVILRYLLAWPSLGLAGAGLWWSLIDRDRQFLHDRLARTRLVRVPA